MWSWMVIAASQPGHYEAREQALAGTGEGMLLEDYIRLRRAADDDAGLIRVYGLVWIG
jgi:hypothetical protein